MTVSQNKFLDRMAMHARAVEQSLSQALGVNTLAGEVARPDQLMAALRHGVLNGGKRFRPFLVLESAALFQADGDVAMPVATALECIHCYSLVHDDLPAMDDDDLRRGKPTVHVAYDEATAILAGDGLLTLAFDLIASADSISAEKRISLVSALSRAAGVGGMVGGQHLDLAHENQSADEMMVTRIHAMKTGALLRFACEAGAMIGDASASDHDAMKRYGEIVGLSFQLSDDLLDITSDAATMGKATGKDAAAGKSTFLSLHGEDWVKRKLVALTQEAHDVLSVYGERAAMLIAAADFVAKRTS